MKMKKILCLLILSFFTATYSQAKEIAPVDAKSSFIEKGDSLILIVEFIVQDNWMVYDSVIGDGGPVPLTFDFSGLDNLTLLKKGKPSLHSKHDDIFEVDLLYFKENVQYHFTFLKEDAKLPIALNGSFEFMCCNLTSGVCLAPQLVDISYLK